MFLLQGLCRILTCPYGQKTHYGTCKSIAIQTNGLGVETSFILTAVPDKSSIQLSNFSIEGLDALAETIFKRTRSSLGLKPSKCEYCQATIDVGDDHVVDVCLRIQLYTAADCQLEHIREQSTRLLGKHIDIKIGRNDNILFHVGLGTFYKTYPAPGRREIRSISKGGVAKCVISFRVDKPEYCPEISLNIWENELLQDANQRSIFLSYFDNNVPGKRNTTTVCLNKYLVTMAPTSGCSKYSIGLPILLSISYILIIIITPKVERVLM